MRVQAFSSELAVGGFNEGVVRRFAQAAEAQNYTPLVGPVACDELRALVDLDHLRVCVALSRSVSQVAVDVWLPDTFRRIEVICGISWTSI